MTVRRALVACLLGSSLVGALLPRPGRAEDAAEAACRQAVATTQARAAELPEGDPSRRFAESDLLTALTEMASGEVEDCPMLVARAQAALETRPYRLRPGERMHGYGPDARS